MAPTKNPKVRGQSLVEFAMVGVIMFMMLAGILEAGRLLLTYSVVSNAAQEGSRYAIARPRDVLPSSEATALAGTDPAYIAAQVVPDGACNIFTKTREKVWSITKSDVQISVTYDDGDGTPIAISDDPSSPEYIEQVIKPGNRAVVEATYKFEFFTPLLNIFAPDGINVKMRAARTIMSRGDSSYTCVSLNSTPVPTRTASATVTSTATSTPTVTLTRTSTPTPTSTRTGTPTITATSTRTPSPTVTGTATSTPSPTITGTATATRTPSRLVVLASPLKSNGNGKPLDIRVRVTDDNGVTVNGAAVSANARGITNAAQTWSGTVNYSGTAGTYQICAVGSFDGSGGGAVNVSVTAGFGTLSGTASATEGQGNWCP